MRSATKPFLAFLTVFMLGSASMNWAQVTTATLYGIVRDQSGAVMPGADVTLTHEGTAQARQTLTGDTGEFVFTALPVGSYTLKIVLPGFKTYMNRGIELAAGQNVRQTYTLEVGGVAEAVTVEGSAPLVNTVSPEQRESIARLQVTELPLSRRNVTNVLRLATGADISGHTRSLRINGIGKHGTGITVDGTDANANPEGRGISQYQGVNYVDVMSIEAVQEVQVIRGILAPEYGSVIGGQVNLISKSGTNEWHGSAFENYQSHILNARQPFVPRLDDSGQVIAKPRQVFNQFGGSLGGPIIRDRVFLFGAYEGYRESTFQALRGQVPTQSLRNDILRALPFPETKAALDTLPLPLAPHPTIPDVGLFFGAGNQIAHENHFVAKGDIRVTQGANLSLTYTRSRPFVQTPQFYVNHSNDQVWDMAQDRATINYTVSRTLWISETRVGINRMRYQRQGNFLKVGRNVNGSEKSPYGHNIPLISVSARFSTPRGEIWDMEGPTYSFDQKFSRHMRQHLLKFGGKYVIYGGSRNKLANPTLSFSTTGDLLANSPRDIEATLGSPPYKSRMHELGFFVQDDWRVSPKLVLNLGLRYDLYTPMVAKPTTSVPVGFYNLAPPKDWRQFDFGPFLDPNHPYHTDAWVNLGPRLGFAYNPDAKSKTVLRGGFGVLFSPQMPGMVRQAVGKKNEPFRLMLSKEEAAALGLRWPVVNDQLRENVQILTEASGKRFVFSVLNPDLQNPYTMNYQLNLEHELLPDLMWEVGYVGVRGVKFIMHRRFNQPDRVTGLRPNPDLVVGGYYVDNSQNMAYNALQTSLRKRFSRDLSFDAHYTWGKGLGVTGGDIGAYYQGDADGNVQNFFNPRADRGPTVGDVAHRFVADWVYNLPRLANTNGFVRHALGGWEASGIFSARSGEAVVIVQRAPDDVPSRSDYVGGRTVIPNWRQTSLTTGCRPGINCGVQYLNVSAFVKVPESPVSRLPIRPGTAGTGLVRGPGFWSLDFSLGKNFKVKEGVRLQFRADMFNALNHVNYGGPDSNIDSPFFGQIRSAHGMRTMQLGARLTF
jgi:hypothetical protein